MCGDWYDEVLDRCAMLGCLVFVISFLLFVRPAPPCEKVVQLLNGSAANCDGGCWKPA